MAIRDDDRLGRTGLNRVRDSSSKLPLLIGVLAAALLAWWLFSNYKTTDVGTPRTSAPTTQTAPNSTNSSGTSKQP